MCKYTSIYIRITIYPNFFEKKKYINKTTAEKKISKTRYYYDIIGTRVVLTRCWDRVCETPCTLCALLLTLPIITIIIIIIFPRVGRRIIIIIFYYNHDRVRPRTRTSRPYNTTSYRDFPSSWRVARCVLLLFFSNIIFPYGKTYAAAAAAIYR